MHAHSYPSCPIALRISLADLSPSSSSSTSDADSQSEIPNGGNTSGFATPFLKLKGESRILYDTICVPLANEQWRERWGRMCLQQPQDATTPRQHRPSYRNVALGIDVDGDHSMGVNDTSNEDDDWERKAELWRLNPAFEADEVVMTRLGMFITSSALFDKSALSECSIASINFE